MSTRPGVIVPESTRIRRLERRVAQLESVLEEISVVLGGAFKNVLVLRSREDRKQRHAASLPIGRIK